MSTCGKVCGVAALALVLTALSGCGSKVTQSGYDKIANGMTVTQVEGILGKGTEKAGVGGAVGSLAGSARVVTWGDENKSITVTFVNDKVVAKAAQGL
jgi:hypothetical protein